ncbi:MAG: glycosyltransferase [Candidatus Handelsmanbacteria bacterium]|nr:glycosyltransferase [Candidatus Handelsmanbacteria bacterium]
MNASLRAALAGVRHHTGVVLPVYLTGADTALGSALLEDTVQALLLLVERPVAICLSVDGEQNGKEVAEDLARRHGVSVCCAPRNKGKLQALRLGVAQLGELPGLEYFAAVDADGDHFANELPNLVRAALHAGGEVLVLGRRRSLHRPMGFPRGEFEELADRVLLDALAFHAARIGAPLHLEYATSLEEVPDFHSGFKLFSRGAAQAAFLQEPQLCGVGEHAYYRHGVESVLTVEALLSGARLVCVNRSTFDEQPITMFGKLERCQLVADKMVWPCKRLGVPGEFVDQWLRNHIPRLLLGTLVPQGVEELRQVRRLVLQEFGIEPGEEKLARPLFV